MREVIFNYDLHARMVQLNYNQAAASRLTGIHTTVISQIVRGRMNPTDEERESISRILKSTEEELFGE